MKQTFDQYLTEQNLGLMAEAIDDAKAERMRNAVLKVFDQEGWTPKNKKDAGLQVDEFIDASLGWPTRPSKMSPFQKEARAVMVKAIVDKFKL